MRLRELKGRNSKLLLHRPSQLPAADTEFVGQTFQSGCVEGSPGNTARRGIG